MREETIIKGFQDLEKRFQQVIGFIQNFTQSVRLDSTGKEVRLLALQKLLLKKGLITEAEMTAEAGDVIKEMQKQAEEEAAKAAAPAIVPATPAEVAQVAATTEAAPVVVPPQA
jgi:hypothetical protein